MESSLLLLGTLQVSVRAAGPGDPGANRDLALQDRCEQLVRHRHFGYRRADLLFASRNPVYVDATLSTGVCNGNVQPPVAADVAKRDPVCHRIVKSEALLAK